MEWCDQHDVGTPQKIVTSDNRRYGQITLTARDIFFRLLKHGHPEVEMLVVLADNDLVDGALVDSKYVEMLITLGAGRLRQPLRRLEAKPGNECIEIGRA